MDRWAGNARSSPCEDASYLPKIGHSNAACWNHGQEATATARRIMDLPSEKTLLHGNHTGIYSTTSQKGSGDRPWPDPLDAP